MKCLTTYPVYAWENDLVQKFKSENNSASFININSFTWRKEMGEEEGWGLYSQRNKE